MSFMDERNAALLFAMALFAVGGTFLGMALAWLVIL